MFIVISNGNSFILDGGLTPGALAISVVVRATTNPFIARK